MVEAGGGPSSFSTVTLLKTLAGSHFDAEVAKLTNQYGKAQVGQFLKTFDFVVDDSLKIVTEKKIALPSQPNPNPKMAKRWPAHYGRQARPVKASTSR